MKLIYVIYFAGFLAVLLSLVSLGFDKADENENAMTQIQNRWPKDGK